MTPPQLPRPRRTPPSNLPPSRPAPYSRPRFLFGVLTRGVRCLYVAFLLTATTCRTGADRFPLARARPSSPLLSSDRVQSTAPQKTYGDFHQRYQSAICVRCRGRLPRPAVFFPPPQARSRSNSNNNINDHDGGGVFFRTADDTTSRRLQWRCRDRRLLARTTPSECGACFSGWFAATSAETASRGLRGPVP